MLMSIIAAHESMCARNGNAWWAGLDRQLRPGSTRPSLANYIVMQVPSGLSKDIAEQFRKRRILVRDCTGWPGVPDGYLRIAIRTREENDQLLHCWMEIVGNEWRSINMRQAQSLHDAFDTRWRPEPSI